ncbi:uncharacterized protein LOC143194164 [Rhynchophorus ferrugineus]|uniref:Insulin-like domain-containing protein n=1 Tax=Rhynchophorus ferrugineus TaxID=354439 RepID=A0A834MM53_RHYFE|nr:hypothetical protein GWI33_023380 [Rhynchophorus ferrugineus]
MKIVLVFVALITFIDMIQSSTLHLYKTEGKFCGDRLERMMSSVCKDYYNSPSKRASHNAIASIYPNIFNYDDYYNSASDSDSNSLTWRDSSYVAPKSLSEFTEIRKREVIKECCLKACSVDTLLLYCQG